MKILVISFAFPPYNTSGSVRVGKLVAFLEARGHEIRVITAAGLQHPTDLDLEVRARIERVPFFNIDAPIDWWRTRMNADPARAESAPITGFRAARNIANMYRAFFAVPDAQIGWLPAALRAVRGALVDWTPDVILSSALPFTGHVIASVTARRIGRPWVAEFRDLFADNPYNDVPAWRRCLDRLIERRVMAAAVACVTVSPALAKTLQAQHHKPTAVVLNGFDPEDLSDIESAPMRTSKKLRIVYTGIIYQGRRDPRPLFEAIRRMGARGNAVEVAFYGQDLRGIGRAASELGVSNRISTHLPVPYRESLRLQCLADALLLLLWDDPRERGVYTGKLFEYVGAARPILAIGCQDGVAAALIRNRGLGVTATEPADIAVALDRWISEIEAKGTLGGPKRDAAIGLSRTEQFILYEQLLERVVAESKSGKAVS